MNATEFLGERAEDLTIGVQRDTVKFATMVDARMWANLMMRAGRPCYWVGGNTPMLNFTANATEREAFGVGEESPLVPDCICGVGASPLDHHSECPAARS